VVKAESRCDLRVIGGDSEENGLFLEKKSEFARGTVGAEVVREMEGGSGACGYGGIGTKSTEGKEAGGFVEAEAGAELTGGGSDDAAAEGGVEGTETVEFDGDGGLAGGGADGAASATDGFARQKKLGKDPAEFGLPAGLFFAGQFGKVGEILVEVWVVDAELGKKFVADFVAGEGGVGVGGVFAPGLVCGLEECFDVGAAGFEEGTEDFALWQCDDGVDGA
jgi:hypothetical protein